MQQQMTRGAGRVPRELLIALGAFVAAFVVGGLASTAVAYNNKDTVFCKHAFDGSFQLTVYWKYDPYYPPTGIYLTAFINARSNWNATTTPVFLLQSTNPNADHHYLAAEPLGLPGPLGNTNQNCTLFAPKRRVGTLVSLNTQRLHQFDPNYPLNGGVSVNYRRSVASHELGHHIGIRHSTVSPSVMNQQRNRDSIYTAQVDDECGVNRRYKSSAYPATCGY